MKTLVKKHKYVVSILVPFLIILGTHLLGYAEVTSVKDRTPQVRDAIVAAVPGVDTAAEVTETHLAAITSLNLRGKGISELDTGDFSGLTALTNLNLYNNNLSNLPDGIFKGLTSLTTIRLGRNTVDPLPFSVSLEKVAEGQFKAVAPAGALFNIVLPITVTNGSVTGGATTVTIPHGSVESSTLTVTRTAGTTADVTVDIGTFPSMPNTHFGYRLVKSDLLPLAVISGANTAPVFTDGASTTRSIAENTAAGQNIGTAVAATDADNDTLTYTFSGTDASAFDIDSSNGQLKTKSALDYETKSNYTVTITVSDGSLTDTITVTINITDVQEVVTPDPPVSNTAPAFLEGENTARIVLENTVAGVNIGDPVLASDVNNDALTYTLGGIDADGFDMDSSGQLITKSPLDYETKPVYTVTVTVADAELSDTITVTIIVIDVNDTVSAVGFVPVADRTPAVRDAIVAAVPNVTDAANVTESQVAVISSLNLRNKQITGLKTGDFSGMTALSNLNLYRNNLHRLPPGIFDGLTALTSLRLGGNVFDPMPLIVFLQNVGVRQFRVVITTGAPFTIVLPINVTNGSMSSGATSVTIPQGSMISETFTVIGTSPKVAVGTLPGLPAHHFGYTLALSNVCNRTQAVAEAIARAVGVSDCSAVTERDLATITSLDLSNASLASLKAGDFDGMFSLQTLYLNNNALTNLPMGVFDDLVWLDELFLDNNTLTTLPSGILSNLTSLTNLYLQSNDLGSLPSDVFDGLSSLRAINLQDNDLTSLPDGLFDGKLNVQRISLSNNSLTSLPTGIFTGLTQLMHLDLSGNPNPDSQISLIVALQKVGTNQFKAIAPSGAPFAMTLPIKVMNGTLGDGVKAIIIPKGNVASRSIAVTRTSGTTAAVTVDIGTPLPSLPSTHTGYALVKATALPLVILPPLNFSPIFEEGASTIRAVAENTAVGTNIGDPVTATDRDTNDTLTYTHGGTDAAAFEVDSETGQIKTKVVLDFETKNIYEIILTVSDGMAADTIPVTINVIDIDENRAPVFTDGASTTRTVAENTAAGTNIGNVITATDPDNDTLTYRLGGQDASAFGIDTNTGQLKTSATLDYETKSIYSVSVTVSDGKITDTIAVRINITDVEEVATGNQGGVEGTSNNAPVFTDESSNNAPVFTDGNSTTRNVSEDTSIGVDFGTPIDATDADGHTLAYSLGGTDASSFSIDSTTGQLRTNAALDYETQSSYTVTITASDGTDEATITVTINVVDVTENREPIFIAGVSISRSVSEDTGSGVDIGTPISATDADGDTLTYTLGGTDASFFSIDSTTGQLRTNTALDYETKSVYSVTITVSDGSLTDSITVTINVTDIDETIGAIVDDTLPNNAPVFTAGSSTTRSVSENTGSGVDIGSAVSATDVDGDTLTYTLSGTDAIVFRINSTTGQLRTSAALDYETKSLYSVTITVSDGRGGSDTIGVTINVTDVQENRAPSFIDGSSTTRSVAENTSSGQDIGTVVTATDPDSDILSYTLGGADSDSFSINSTNGQLRTSATLNYESKTSYSVTVDVSDGNGGTDSIRVTINVTNVNEAPSFTEGSNTSRSVAENTGSGQNIGSEVSATDPDSGTTLTYTLGGTDASSFSIVSASGQLQTKSALDYETQTSYTVMITVSDGSLTDSITVTITVTDVSENSAPVFTEGTNTSRAVDENTASGQNIGSAVAATDTDVGDTLTYTLGGTDAASFSIDSATGQLQTKAALDYETKTSYTVMITVSDGSLTDSITVTITVTDVNERLQRTSNRAPVFTDGTSTSRAVEENTASGQNIGTAVGATDADTGDTLTYTLGGTDAASFSIVSTSGQLQTSAALDYEAKNAYSVTVSVTDGNGGSDSITVTINVTDVDETTINPPLSDRTSQVRDAIVAAVPGITEAADVTVAHLAAISSLTLTNNKNITALKTGDFAGLASLKTLFLYGNAISDLSGLSASADLPKLATLHLYNNAISDISALENLTSLTTLVLSNNSISDISVLDNLTELTTLLLGYNSISDISVLDNLTSLETLRLEHNFISDISVLDNLTELTYLVLQDNSISDISALGNLTKLKTLVLRRNPISDYGPLRTLKTAVEATDSEISIDIDINNTPPVFTDGASTTRSIAENTVSGTNIGNPISATDADTDDTLTYSFANFRFGNEDSFWFDLDSTSGQLRTKSALDYEAKTSYTVIVDVSDGNDGLDRISVTINVTDVSGAAPSVETPPIISDNTALFTNFPNPFNPETWVPYQLSKPADVTLTIYDMRGVVVRELKLGHKAAGVYTSRSRAIHWDGRNSIGEKVATGVYFYTLKAGDFSATRKMLIRK